MASNSLPFIDLGAQRQRLGNRIDTAVQRVIEQGRYINGPEVQALEEQLATFAGCAHALGCSSGTDALLLPLMAWDIGPGDAVLVPAFTFVATAEAVALTGATPVIIDVLPDTFNIDPDQLAPGCATAEAAGLTPRAVITVDLFGQPADYRRLLPEARRLGLKVLDDAAQGFGGSLDGRRIGRFGDATATSFFPAKPLGCYGDGGAVLTDDPALDEAMRSLRVHGQGRDKYDNVRIGLNARLDTIQAAILLEKLDIFAEELEARQAVANRYTEGLGDIAAAPVLIPGATSAWAQYTLRLPQREAVQTACAAAGVPTMVYYPLPLHRQTGYARYPTPPHGCPVSDRLAGEVLSLPMHPYLAPDDQDRIITTVREALSS